MLRALMGLAPHSARADCLRPLPSDIQCGAPSSLFAFRFSLYFFLARRRRLFALFSSLFAIFLPCPPQAPFRSSLFALRSSLYFFHARRRRLFALRSSLFAIFLPCPPQAPFHSSLFAIFLPCSPQAPFRSSLFAFRYISSLPAAGAFSLFTIHFSLFPHHTSHASDTNLVQGRPCRLSSGSFRP